MYEASGALTVTSDEQWAKVSFQIDLTLGRYTDFRLPKLINIDGTVCERIEKCASLIAEQF